MKHPFFKSVLVLGAALALMNCNSDNVATQPNDDTVSDACWELTVGDQTILIYPTGIVTDAAGNTVGAFVTDPSNPSIGNITNVDGSQTVIEHINLDYLPVLQPGSVPGQLPLSSATTSTPTQSSASVNVPTQSSAVVNVPSQSSANVLTDVSSSSAKPASSAAQQQNNNNQQSSGSCTTGSQCFDKISGKCVNFYAQGLTTAKGSQYSYNEKCEMLKWYDAGDLSNGSASAGDNQQQPKSSSSAKSSSSQQQQQQPKSSSSSQQQQQQGGGGNLLPKIIDNNKKTGYATRYWDSCKPHCAWEGKGGPVARTCNADGMSKASSDAKSVCDGGNAGTCFDQTPQIVNDTIAYAFAATPGGGNDCGKCYMLTFKGTGASATNTPTDDHHRKIKGKHLIVMSSNIGYDVSHNQFDLMIPGGGPGAFNGCGKMGISCAGAQYGGFLTTCNYNKDCLIKMCNSEYSNESLRNGCLFLANWMDAANNPEIEFVQVECPAALAAKY